MKRCLAVSRAMYLAMLVPVALTVTLMAQEDAVSLVNPYIGTGEGKIGYGGTMPFVGPPFAMTSWTAQTRQDKIGIVSYKYEDTAISGFIGTHQAAIWMGDYGYVTLMPEIGALKTSPEDRKLAYTHGDETVGPDYYSVNLDAGGAKHIRTEVTATEHCGYLRFTFPQGQQARVLVESSRPGIAGHAEVSTAARELAGYNPDRMDAHLGPLKLPNFKGYFVVQFKQPLHTAAPMAHASRDTPRRPAPTRPLRVVKSSKHA